MQDKTNETTALTEASRKLLELLPSILNEHKVEYGIELDEITVTVSPELVNPICNTLKMNSLAAFDYLRCLSVVDYEDKLEMNYHLFSYTKRHKMVLKTELTPIEPKVASVSSIWRTANWFERESHDLFGIIFDDHPNLNSLLLPEGFEGHPGLKSYPLHEYKEW